MRPSASRCQFVEKDPFRRALPAAASCIAIAAGSPAALLVLLQATAPPMPGSVGLPRSAVCCLRRSSASLPVRCAHRIAIPDKGTIAMDDKWIRETLTEMVTNLDADAEYELRHED